MIERVHNPVHKRRARVLSEMLADLMPEKSKVLDVGCGDGLIASLLKQNRPDVDVQGVDVLVRRSTCIPVEAFDGRVLPYRDRAFDVVMFVDILHHTLDPTILLREAARTARQAIVIKDHTRDGFMSAATLRFMDWIGNARHGVALPYNYWPRAKWLDVFHRLDLTVQVWKQNLGLYPRPAHWLFDRSLHFIARLDINHKASDRV